jgi:kynureninase
MSMLKRPEIARQLDAKDPLARFRTRFHMPRHGDGEAVYLCGNSLGLQPVTAAALVQETLEDWQRLAVRAHFEARHPWMPYHELATSRMAQLVGAEPIEVVCMNSLTVNLHLMMVSFYRPRPSGIASSWRSALFRPIAMPWNRRSDSTATTRVRHSSSPRRAPASRACGWKTSRRSSSATRTRSHSCCCRASSTTRVRCTTSSASCGRRAGVAFPSASTSHTPSATCRCRLHEWEVDFAVWCSYKYLNAGPGAVAGCFVHERYARDTERPRFAGWWGHDKASRFQMGPRFAPIPGAEGWQLSNPPILSFAPLLASLEIFAEAGMDALRAKSLQLSGYLEMLLKDALGEQLDILTPLAPSQRGCQLSVRLLGGATRGRALLWQLEARGIVCDWREPDVIRVAPVPLYNRFADVHQFVATIAELLRG